MKKTVFDPEKAVGESLIGFDRQQLCEFIIKLCERVKSDVGAGAYHGGIYPENISIDDDGNVAIGGASRADWAGQELEFLPPELYWNHRPTSASDVYAIGMLLYYAVSGGKLPFDGECRDAQLRRMGGDDFAIPAAAGRRLGRNQGQIPTIGEKLPQRDGRPPPTTKGARRKWRIQMHWVW